MKIFIKTLKGEQFQIEVDPSDLILAVKEKIAVEKQDLQADRQKLIHAGKVLKDSSSLLEAGITENEFLVCMVTKETAKPKQAVAPAAAAPTPAPVSAQAPPVAAPTLATATPTQTSAPIPTPNAPVAVPLSAEAIQQLIDMGFPEAEARSALRAAQGNTDLAVEFLMSGIPEERVASPRGAVSSPASDANNPLAQLRQHPQFEQLKGLVQSNPAALPQVLELIGRQNPELLQLIHSHQEQFLQMMNEPMADPSSAGSATAPPSGGSFGVAPGPEAGGINPVQLLQMLQALPPQQRAAAAQSVGISPEQLQAFTQMLSTMSPEQIQQLTGGMGGGGGHGGPPPGSNVIRLTDEEMASVTRLTELGFDQQDAVAAYLACDKNEAMAANLLLEGWSAADGMGDEMGDGGFDGGPDDMYS
eukprot:gene1797-3486_t